MNDCFLCRSFAKRAVKNVLQVFDGKTRHCWLFVENGNVLGQIIPILAIDAKIFLQSMILTLYEDNHEKVAAPRLNINPFYRTLKFAHFHVFFFKNQKN